MTAPSGLSSASNAEFQAVEEEPLQVLSASYSARTAGMLTLQERREHSLTSSAQKYGDSCW